MWSWRKMENISWNESVRNEEVWHKVEKERNIPRTIKRRKANWTGHNKRRNCLLKDVTEIKIDGRMDVTERRRRRRKQLLYDLKETRGSWKLIGETLACTLWISRFGIGYGSVVRQTTVWQIVGYFTCARCNKHITASSSLLRNTGRFRPICLKDLLQRTYVQHVRENITKFFPQPILINIYTTAIHSIAIPNVMFVQCN